MASDEDLDAVAELLMKFTEFGTPTTKPLSFEAIIGGNLSHEAQELLQVATQQRETLLDGITNMGGRVDPRNVVAAVENYLPSVYKITHSMEQSATAQIRLNKPLEFSWTSVLVKKNKQRKEYKCQVLVYEVCFILTVQAMAHYNVARMLLDPERPNRAANLVAAAKELRKGAGILEYVSQVMLPRWVNPPENRPPEVMPAVVAVLAEYFVCMAQRLTVQQAILKGTPASTVGKLLLGLSERSHNLVGSVRRLGPVVDTLFEPIVEEPALVSTMSHALAMKFLGDAAKDKGKPGEAVAFLSLAVDQLNGIIFSPTMDKLLRPEVEAARVEILDKYHVYREDNEKIYFEGVPTRDRLNVPAGSFIATAVDFEMPEVDAVAFGTPPGEQHHEADAQNAPAAPANGSKRASGGFSSWFGMGGSKKKEGASSKSGRLEAPPGYDKEVFDGLPPDVQQEVIADYEASRK
ncbi:Hypothetical Protein FCC1311_023052 [Hondaea fermentalgiana]|uniref:pH-response regulator protein palC n=1 Tax=Hondaea fermentalgiana TaxID=2315210 RepID=A0A2R5G6D1_9STRA|nr:Hypothetical Protein FCC1311_023052 [Hondaea fermentalgiana]|eukprot:GBG26085.1 Hypothetical Protein FCC1311_023052 [Hondaea fermentalgiana]